MAGYAPATYLLFNENIEKSSERNNQGRSVRSVKDIMKRSFSPTFPGDGTRYNGITYGYSVKSYALAVI